MAAVQNVGLMGMGWLDSCSSSSSFAEFSDSWSESSTLSSASTGRVSAPPPPLSFLFYIQSKIYTNVSVFDTSPKIAHNFQDGHPYFVNLWKVCVYSVIRNWYHAKKRPVAGYNLRASSTSSTKLKQWMGQCVLSGPGPQAVKVNSVETTRTQQVWIRSRYETLHTNIAPMDMGVWEGWGRGGGWSYLLAAVHSCSIQ